MGLNAIFFNQCARNNSKDQRPVDNTGEKVWALVKLYEWLVLYSSIEFTQYGFLGCASRGWQEFVLAIEIMIVVAVTC